MALPKLWWPIDKLPPLAFDHDDIMRDAVSLYQTKVAILN